ncbi:TetR/AcrR family transcriptional regulator [Pseudomaricurvus alcaniphilus]|uniref:TetR/AcrR family transcriptional regulator n=1 Tax=Pseudomaricurvus alcaniphilus TaxID=1166482 RepID=UPI0014085264|nr:TetR/AcrR family transcriptional regulator [Pseudomaricurvus alcaniphilus]NHN38993.1 TetR/AcrR family transcriptional regulator [Pseudomaricurvus alcaniphilus]
MARGNSKANNSHATILKVSIELFAQHGFEGVTMRQIAQAAKVTLPAIYHHFGNKEELYRAVETDLYGQHADSLLVDLHAAASPEECLRHFIGNLIDRLESDPAYFKLVQRNLVEDWPENHQFLVDLSLQGVFDELKKLLNTFIDGSGDGMQPILIFSMIFGFLTLQPVARMVSGYRLAKVSRAKKRAMLIDNIISFIKVSPAE